MTTRSIFSALMCALAIVHSLRAAEISECRWAAVPPVIDGVLDDPAWKNAQVVDAFTSAWLPEGKRTPPTATKARLLWDREYLYFSAEMEDWDGERIETRVLVRQQGEWAGYSFAWNDTETDAALVPKDGAARGGWHFPARQECAVCHSRAANYLLGLTTSQLNRNGADGENQLARWEREGLLKFDHAKTEQAEWRAEFDKLKLSDVAFQAKLDTVLPTAMKPARTAREPSVPKGRP